MNLSAWRAGLLLQQYTMVYFSTPFQIISMFFFFENKELSKIKRGARGTATQIAVDASCQTQEPPGGGES